LKFYNFDEATVPRQFTLLITQTNS